MFLGVDIGGTNLRVGVVQHHALIHEQRALADFSGLCARHPPDEAWRQIIATTAATLRQCLMQYPQAKAVGIGFPGFIDPVHGTVAQSPNLPGLRNVDLAGDLSAAIGLPVVVENDALAAAYGEYVLCDPKPHSLLYAGLGTGVGGGMIYAGRPFTGEHGVAMEIGHLIVEPGGRLCGCGNHGCMEQYASASGIAQSYHMATGQRVEVNAIAQAAREGGQAAVEAFSLAGAALAQALAHVVKSVDVGLIVIGGGVSQAWDLMAPAFFTRLEHDMIPVLRDRLRVQPSASGDRAGIIGAAALAEIILASSS
ncbi:ROK family protein [Methylovorus glucosotrophus]|uniref:ROK family protein n=1 Tax=Methylovorus glucosotrophus (strain SIP3-4) TaxID=582744 RepID=C6XD95_METGS|nr:ROK family protein [Methylovorus glucosotrophus]ACT50520.1 ROK family protein [Methylovorus glucosotrophus SIP3-4]KAF0844075.1 glucokinase [Methylovorus glucosotrophus]